MKRFDNLIVGQGIAGSTLAWTLHFAGQSVLIADDPRPDSASRVSAGLITPVTGKRLVQTPDFSETYRAAKEFYQQVEAATGVSFFAENSMLRLFSDEAARDAFLHSGPSGDFSDRDTAEDSGAVSVSPWQGRVQADGPVQFGIEVAPAARVNVSEFLRVTRAFFQNRQAFLECRLNPDDVEASGQISLSQHNVAASRMILATGAATTTWFPHVPTNPARGDILRVRIPDYQQQATVHRSIWIAADDQETQRVGSTYDWNFADATPTAAGRNEILTKLQRIVPGKVQVLDQTSGIRPGMKDYQPVIGRHADDHRILIMNGLGSKGCLRAPRLAQEVVALIQGRVPAAAHDIRRLDPKPGTPQRPLTRLAQEAVAAVLQPGDVAIDATVGNGFDSCFLAEQVGPAGRVVGFDVQQSAIEATQKRLAAHDLSNVQLHLESHEHLARHVESQTVAAVMFNLGYLPKSDHAIITMAETSAAAIAEALSVLRPGGILTVLSYRGHEGGMEEFRAVERLFSGLADRYHLRRIDSTPAKPTSPVLFIVRNGPADE